MADGPRALRLVDPARPPLAQAPPPVHVAICVLTRGMCPSKFAFNLADLVGFTAATIVQRGLLLSLKFEWATYVHVGRQEVLDECLKDPTITHLLWLDDDMGFPKDALIRLLAHGRPIVGANYCTRIAPYQPTAIHTSDPPLRCMTVAGQTGLESVEAVGFGCLLTARKVFEALPQPCFETFYDKAKGQWTGEDVGFCRAARAAGFPIYVDHDLSHQVLHCGTFQFTLAHAEAWAAEDAIHERPADPVPAVAGAKEG
jgi:hypothetical protein